MRAEPIELLWTMIAAGALVFSLRMAREYALDYRAARFIEDPERRSRGREWTGTKIEREAFRSARLAIYLAIGLAACWAPPARVHQVTILESVASIGLVLAALLDALGVYREWMHWQQWRRTVLAGSRDEVDGRKTH